NQHNVVAESAAFFSTNNVAFPAEPFREIGGMDATWSIAGGEDRDLCRRWVRHGYPLIKAPAAIVRHCHALTLAEFWRQHFHYGRGACQLRRRSVERDGDPLPFESAAFYGRLVTRPFAIHPPARALSLSALIVLSQGATVAGFVRQYVATRGEVAPAPG